MSAPSASTGPAHAVVGSRGDYYLTGPCPRSRQHNCKRAGAVLGLKALLRIGEIVQDSCLAREFGAVAAQAYALVGAGAVSGSGSGLDPFFKGLVEAEGALEEISRDFSIPITWVLSEPAHPTRPVGCVASTTSLAALALMMSLARPRSLPPRSSLRPG